MTEVTTEPGWMARTSRLLDGATFLTSHAISAPAIWGSGPMVLWPAGEPVGIVGPQGVGKSTIGQQLLLARMGLRDEVMGVPVIEHLDFERALYLAMDRPDQAARSMARMVSSDDDLEVLRERLTVWKGPPPFNVVSDGHRALADMADELLANTVLVDSLKDLSPRLSDEEVGHAINASFQEAVARGIQVIALHHNRKASADNRRPRSLDDVYGSSWLTAGMGSVLGIFGKPGATRVEVTHLKIPNEPFGPVWIEHDRASGTSQQHDAEDALLATVIAAGEEGVTLAQAAMSCFGEDDSSNQKKARRRLERLVTDTRVGYIEGSSGGTGGGGTPARWMLKEGGQ